MHSRKHHFLLVAALCWMLPTILAWTDNTSIRNQQFLRFKYVPQWLGPCSLSILVLGPVPSAEAVLPSPPPQYTIQQQQKRHSPKLIRQLENLEDDRLVQCRDKGSKWEQCFFYGTDTVGSNRRGEFLRSRPSSLKNGPLTW